MVDADKHIYEYSQRLEKESLPTSNSRIFVLHNSQGLNYDRLKTQYYLLPHNIYNYGSLPPSRGVRPGDYILALGDLPDLRFLPDKNLLTWPANKQLDVNLVDDDPLGNLYVVAPPATNVPSMGIKEIDGSDHD